MPQTRRQHKPRTTGPMPDPLLEKAISDIYKNLTIASTSTSVNNTTTNVFASDEHAQGNAIYVDESNNVFIGDGGYANYAKITPAGLLSFHGARDISLHHGSFSSSVTQTIVSATAAYSITYNSAEIEHGVTLSDSSRINIADEGCYLITFSAIGKSALPNKTLDIWLAVDGVNVANSNTVSRFVGSANERIITVTFIYDFTDGQYFELKWCSNDTGTVLLATGTQTNPTRPACPSIILTVNEVSKD